MRTLEGEELEASYSPEEWQVMADLRAAGVPARELRLLHEAKARFGATILSDPLDRNPGTC